MKKLLFVLGLCLFLGLAWAAAAQTPDGKTLFARCEGCHGPKGTLSPFNVGKPLKGLSPEEITRDLKGYRAKKFGGKMKHIMERMAGPLSDREIEALVK